MVVRGSLWRLAANGLGIVIGVATAALLLRHLGKVDTGRYVTVLSLIAIPVTVADVALNITGSRELALVLPQQRRRLLANLLGQRLVAMSAALLLVFLFAVAVGYPQSMVIGTVLSGFGAVLAAIANVLLLPLAVELRNLALAAVDLAKQVITLIGAGLLVALGASLTPFFSLLIAAGALSLLLVAPLAGRGAFARPRLERGLQRRLAGGALPQAAAMALGQIYFRLVIVVMSLISSPVQTGYFAGSLRAVEAGVQLPIVVAGVALPLLSHAARHEPQRFRGAVRLLGEGMVLGGVVVVLLAVHLASPVMVAIGGHSFRPAGAVLRIQAIALLVVALDQIWAAGLVALGRQRELILTNGLAVLALAGYAAALVPARGAIGGAIASVLGEATLGLLIYWRLARAAGPAMVGERFLIRLALSAAPAVGILFLPLPGVLDSLLAAGCFAAVAIGVRAVPGELYDALLRFPAR